MPFFPTLRDTAVQQQQQQQGFMSHIVPPMPVPLDDLHHLIETGSVTWHMAPD
jgi:hypothetical protein